MTVQMKQNKKALKTTNHMEQTKAAKRKRRIRAHNSPSYKRRLEMRKLQRETIEAAG